MHRGALGLHGGDEPFDLAPAAKIGDIADRAIFLRAHGGLEAGFRAVAIDQRERGIGIGAVDHETVGHGKKISGFDKVDQHGTMNSCQAAASGFTYLVNAAQAIIALFSPRDPAAMGGTGLARPGRSWQGKPMTTPPSPPRPTMGGGFLIAIGAVFGAFFGGMRHQPSAGLLLGLSLGILLATLLWWRQR